jgi:hypothetical protein
LQTLASRTRARRQHKYQLVPVESVLKSLFISPTSKRNRKSKEIVPFWEILLAIDSLKSLLVLLLIKKY